VVPGLLASDALDLDDLGTQPGEDLRAAGSGLMAAQVDHADSVQGPVALSHEVTPSLSVVDLIVAVS
jgi:hypothetical protein